MESLQELLSYLTQIWAGLRWQDALDVLVVSFVLYKLFSFIKETRAIHLIRGLLLLVVIYFIANNFLELKILTSVMQNAATLIIVAIPVLFQPELRRALSELGRGFSVFPSDRMLKGKELFDIIRVLVATTQALSEEKIGALMVIERKIGLNEHIETGVVLDAQISQEILHTIFYEGTPLHDGAVILRGNRIVAASVQLPLTEHKQSPAGTYWGMRHRAALGISEQSDAASLVVSEETGSISLIVDGKTHRNLTEDSLERQLLELFQMGPMQSAEKTGLLSTVFGNKVTAAGALEEPPEPGLFSRASEWGGKVFLNLRFIAVVVAVIWGLAVGLGTAPPPRLELENSTREMLVPIEIQGKNDNLIVKITPSQVSLRLNGKAEQLDEVDPSQLHVFVEIPPGTELNREQYLPVGVLPPANVQIRDVIPRLVKVQLMRVK